MYTIQALWTQAREELDVTTIIVANRSYAILEFEFSRVGAEGDGTAARALMDIGRPELDFAALARAQGVPGRRVDDVPGADRGPAGSGGRARSAPDRGAGMSRAIVTGGASGIGAAVVALLRERGDEVVVLDRDPSDGIQVDVTDAAAVDAAVEEAAERLGGLDIVINNAGVGAQGTVEDNSDEEWRRVFDINVRRDGARLAGGAAVPARERTRRDRQHLLGRGDGGAPPARALQRDQGRGHVAHAGDGRRSRPRGHPRELRGAGHGRHAVDRAAARRGRGPRGRARGAGGAPADGAPRVRRGGRRGDRLPGDLNRHDGHDAARRRRDAGLAPARAS